MTKKKNAQKIRENVAVDIKKCLPNILMAPKYTSTPIRYAGSGSGEKKMTIKKEAGAEIDQAGKLKNRHVTSKEAKERSSSSASSSKKEVLKHSTQHVSVKKERVSEKPREQGLLKSKTKSVVEDLAEKRKRLMQKLRNDEDDIIAEKAMKQEKKGNFLSYDFRLMYIRRTHRLTKNLKKNCCLFIFKSSIQN